MGSIATCNVRVPFANYLASLGVWGRAGVLIKMTNPLLCEGEEKTFVEMMAQFCFLESQDQLSYELSISYFLL